MDLRCTSPRRTERSGFDRNHRHVEPSPYRIRAGITTTRLARAARRAGWSETGCVWISRTVWILEDLVVKPETTGSTNIGARLVRTLVDDLSAATAKQGHLYGSTPDRPELIQFWREAGFDVGSPNTPTLWNHPECTTLHHKAYFPGKRPFAQPLGREFSRGQAFKKGVAVH